MAAENEILFLGYGPRETTLIDFLVENGQR